VPWARLGWVTWRQHRAALAGAAALLAAFSFYLMIMGLRMRGALGSLGLTACHSYGTGRCATMAALFQSRYDGAATFTTAVLQAVPVLTGVFVGGPLLAREFETGTFRFAWTQGCGRVRWLLAKLVPLAAAVTGAAAAFSVLFSWYYHPFMQQHAIGATDPRLFDLRGVDFAAWTLAAFMLGVFAGAAIRRVVPAIAASLTAWTGLILATVLYFRKHYQAPLTARTLGSPAGPGGPPWVLSEWWTGPGGRVLTDRQIFTVLGQMKASLGRSGTDADAARWLSAHHFASWATLQPANRFWAFQLIEGGWLLALALLLGAATVWLVRRRAA
jgi:hypothetical protein